jgi:hypothetical protein
LRPVPEAVLELIEPPRQPAKQRPRVIVEHHAAAYAKGLTRTMSSNLIIREFPREFTK